MSAQSSDQEMEEKLAAEREREQREAREREERFKQADQRAKEEFAKSDDQIKKEYKADQKRNATGRDYLRQQGYSDDDIQKHNMLEKEETARKFYKDPKGNCYDDAEANNHMRGIDFRKDVSVETAKKGELYGQHQTLKEKPEPSDKEKYHQGNYYAPVGTQKEEVGIVGERASGPNDPGGRKMDVYEVQRDTPVLKSTARDVELEDRRPSKEGKAVTEYRYGGGQQIATQDKGAFERVVDRNRLKDPDQTPKHDPGAERTAEPQKQPEKQAEQQREKPGGQEPPKESQKTEHHKHEPDKQRDQNADQQRQADSGKQSEKQHQQESQKETQKQEQQKQEPEKQREQEAEKQRQQERRQQYEEERNRERQKQEEQRRHEEKERQDEQRRERQKEYAEERRRKQDEEKKQEKESKENRRDEQKKSK